MQDNSTNDIMETLIRYMDDELSADEKSSIESLLNTDAALQQRYQQMLAGRQAIKMQGLKERVAAIQKEYLQQTASAKTNELKKGKAISLFKIFMSVAAALVIIVAGYTVIQYSTTTNNSVYAANFISYNAPVSRGNETADNIITLYNAGKYNDAIFLFNNLSNKTQQDYFIAAQAYLQLNSTQAAIHNFKQLQSLNNSSNEKYFVQETEYYLMLAYIKNGNIDEAEKLLKSITSNRQHLFYNKAKNISRFKLKILRWKNE